MLPKPHANILPFASLLAVLLLLTGCATLRVPPGTSDSLTDASVPPAAAPAPTYTIEIHPERGEVGTKTVPLGEQSYVQNAVDESGALRRFRRIKIQVVRKGNVAGHKMAKMEVDFDNGRRQVPMQSDYALHPGDRVMIIEDSSSIVDDVMGRLLGDRFAH